MAIRGRRATFEERVQACEAIERGSSPDEVAKLLGVSRTSVFDWQKTYRKQGKEALRTKKTPGPRARLSDEQMSQLGQLIAGNDPKQLSFEYALWTRGMIRELIIRQFGVTLSLVSVGRNLDRLGISSQRPIDVAGEHNPAKVAEWKSKTFPQIQAEAKKAGALICFAAETSHGDYNVGSGKSRRSPYCLR